MQYGYKNEKKKEKKILETVSSILRSMCVHLFDIYFYIYFFKA